MSVTLISSIELLSNHKSFKLFVGSTRTHFWLLIHFKHLEISNYKIQYQVNNGVRQRKNTEHPKRWMKKQFTNTAQILEYLSAKSYDLHHIEIEFINGWKIKEQPQIEFAFYTNSTVQRDKLIDKLLGVAGLELKDKSALTPNITYMLKATGEMYPLTDELLPDEFWTNDQLEAWKAEYRKKYYSAAQEDHSEGVPFYDYVNPVSLAKASLFDESKDHKPF